MGERLLQADGPTALESHPVVRPETIHLTKQLQQALLPLLGARVI